MKFLVSKNELYRSGKNTNTTTMYIIRNFMVFLYSTVSVVCLVIYNDELGITLLIVILLYVEIFPAVL